MKSKEKPLYYKRARPGLNPCRVAPAILNRGDFTGFSGRKDKTCRKRPATHAGPHEGDRETQVTAIPLRAWGLC